MHSSNQQERNTGNLTNITNGFVLVECGLVECGLPLSYRGPAAEAVHFPSRCPLQEIK